MPASSGTRSAAAVAVPKPMWTVSRMKVAPEAETKLTA